MSNVSDNKTSNHNYHAAHILAMDTIGENLLAFEMLESQACCNKTQKADTDDTVWESVYSSAPIN